MKKCKWCQTEIDDNAKVCPNCKKDLRNWFIKHPIICVILGLVIIGMIGSSGNKPRTSSTTLNVQEQSKSQEYEISKDNYNKIKTDMTIEEVDKILGEPNSVSENEIEGFGKTEMYHYQKSFSLQAIDVFFTNGKVTSKNWTDLNN
jgi:hypothetical protein